MKFWDKTKLVFHEYKYEKVEWIISLILQWLIFTSVFFLFTIAKDINKVCSDYLKPIHKEGYCFELIGYDKSDVEELQKMGFRDIEFSEEYDKGYALIDSLENIWGYKIKASLQGKDIWNEGLDEIISVMFFCKITLVSIGAIMLIVMVNNLSNSFGMKLIRRKRYIQMLIGLGCGKEVCKSIYYGVFNVRNGIAILMASVSNALLIKMLNNYMHKRMYINSEFQGYNINLLVVMVMLSIGLMWISFRKQWRMINEY